MNVSGKIFVDGKAAIGTLVVKQDWLDVTAPTSLGPDRSWNYVDPAGHYHAWSVGEALPSLPTLAEHNSLITGPNADEDYFETTYNCKICGVDVQPGRRALTSTQRIRGLKSWSVEVDAEILIPTRVSIRVSALVGWTYFGVAQAVELKAEHGTSDPTAKYHTLLVGIGELGLQKF